MNEIFITSDLHISHNVGFLYEPRGFTNVKEMNEVIVEKWNAVVKDDDIIYDLGDLAMNDIDDAIKYLKQLNGTHWWIRGNHDSLNKVKKITDECPNIHTISNPEASWATMLKYNNKIMCYLSHYPTLTSNYDNKHFSQHVINMHGHTHQQKNWLDPLNPFMYHVGMDSHNCMPVHIDEVITDIRQRWNEIGQLPMSVKPEDMYPYRRISE